jgi:carbon-monoxide dehydrogenase iron sulfur subunit
VLVGDHFFVDDYMLKIPQGRFVCMWALQSMIPLFPLANERHSLDENHWARKAERIACPDPKGKVIYKVERLEDDPG